MHMDKLLKEFIEQLEPTEENNWQKYQDVEVIDGDDKGIFIIADFTYYTNDDLENEYQRTLNITPFALLKFIYEKIT